MYPAVVTAVLLLVGVLNTVTAQPPERPPDLNLLWGCQNYKDKPCGDGWSHLENRCAKYFHTPKNFTDAQAHCRSLQSHLVSIHNRDEMLHLLCFTWTANPELQAFWIGATVSGLGFKYLDGTQFRFQMWYRGEPNNANGNEYCIESNFMAWGFWNDVSCTEERNFVCAKTVIISS